MKFIVFLAIVLCVVCCGADSDVDVKPFSCTPSEWFQKDCNHCQCGDSGTWAQCDVDLCDPEDKTKKLQAPKDCKEKDRFFDGCNDCFCRGNGLFSCTLKDCFMIMGNREPKAVAN